METLFKHKNSFTLLILLILYSNSFAQISTIIPASGFGGETNQQTVMNNWKFSGAYPVQWGILPITNLIDVNEDWNINPGELYIGQRLMNNIATLDPQQQTMLYFPAGAYYIETPLIIPEKVIFKGAGGDASMPGETQFHFDFTESKQDDACITFSNAYHSAIEDICLKHPTGPTSNTSEDSSKFDNYGNTVEFNTGTMHCWMRGVESIKTRRFHVNITGGNNTVSGCYFHDAYQYGTGGQGYGVVLSGNNDDYNSVARYNRIENNIYKNLRHAMVFQYHPHQNVLAYNYSTHLHNDDDADIAFHTKKNNDLEFGPIWNLCEGNMAKYIRFDRNGGNYENGPYNTVFRCLADKFKVSERIGFLAQYMQNVVGCNTPSTTNEGKIKKYGFQKYWLNNEWVGLPADSCSYYLTEEPAFFDFHSPDLFEWPFIPDNVEIIPAYFRYKRNNGYYLDEPFTDEVVFAGWDIYDICGPPNIRLYSSSPINNTNDEHIAMHNIEAGPYELANNNQIVFKCENRIVLKTGFKVNAADNNYFQAIAGDICDNKSNATNQTAINPELTSIGLNLKHISFSEIEASHFKFNEVIINSDAICINEKTVRIGPNPNNGIFTLFLSNYNVPIKIQIIDIGGNLILSKEISIINNIEIDIRDKPKSIYLLKIISVDDITYHKIIYSL